MAPTHNQEPIEISANDINNLVQRVVNLHKKGSRTIISIAGAPGSGKTTLAHRIVEELNTKYKAIVLGQDGYHLYRHELAAMKDPVTAFERRGAPFTYNVEKFVQLVKSLKKRQNETITAPTFDHKLKDPTENAIVIGPEIEFVILEGNYVSLPDAGWNSIEDYVDETWYIETPADLVRARIIKRHLEAGIAQTEEEATQRADGSDLQNARYIAQNSKKTTVIIKGV